MGTAWSCFCVVGSAEYSRCEYYAVYLAGQQYDQRHEKVILQHDNARPHVTKPVKTYLEKLKSEVLPHPLYFPDIAPSDYYLFRSITYSLADQQFVSMKTLKNGLIHG